MQALNVKVLKKLIKDMPDEFPIYIGDDEELNGVHRAFFAQEISKEDVSEISCGEYNDKGFMIS